MSEDKLYTAEWPVTGTFGTKNKDSKPFEVKNVQEAKRLSDAGIIVEHQEKEPKSVEKKEDKRASSRQTKEEKAPKKEPAYSTKKDGEGQYDKK